MTITAKFSNGIETTYKGYRDVKAAWIVIGTDGKVCAKGYSLDMDKACKSAENTARDTGTSLIDDDKWMIFLQRSPAAAASPEHRARVVKQVREFGLADDVPVGKLSYRAAYKLARDFNTARRDAGRKLVNVEVVAL